MPDIKSWQSFKWLFETFIFHAFDITERDGRHFIPSPMGYGDGDLPVIEVLQLDDGWELTDQGATMQRIGYRMYGMPPPDWPTTNQRFLDALSRHGVELRSGCLVRPLRDDQPGEAYFDFLHVMLKSDEIPEPYIAPVTPRK